MVNKCTAPKCKTGNESIDDQSKKTATLHFPIKKPDLNKKWISFVIRINW